MFKYAYSENDEIFKELIDKAESVNYKEHFTETITKNSIEAEDRYKKSHICKKYIVSGTRGWECTIRATHLGWSTEFGFDGDHEEKTEGNTPEENFILAYKWATNHYGKLLTQKQYG